MAAYKDEQRGTWYVSFHYYDWTGKNCRKVKRGFKTKREATEWEHHFRMKEAADLDMTFGEFVQAYTRDMKPKLKHNTWLTKEHILRTKLLPYFENKKMCDIRAKDIIQWQNERISYRDEKGKPYAPTYIAAKLSKGEGLDGGMELTEPLNVIYQSAEDGLADTVKPRLEQAGADCEKISVIDEKIKSLSMIDERLEEAVIKTGAKLLILDPIQAYLGGDMDMNRANEARHMTKKLAALAEKYQCAIGLVGHMNKAAGNKAAYRGMGSIDFFAVARSVLLVGRVEGEENIRAVVQIKNNLAAFGHPKAFALSEDGFQWLGDYEITADEVLGGIAPKANKMEQAKRLLRGTGRNKQCHAEQ